MSNPCFDCEKCIECKQPCFDFKKWVKDGCPKESENYEEI